MVGIIILIYSLYLYLFRNERRLSILFFLSFCFGGFQILTDSVIGVKNTDLALIFTLVVTAYWGIHKKDYFKVDLTAKLILAFVGFLLLSMGYSILHYGFTLYDVIQGARVNFIILSFFFLRLLRKKDLAFLLKATIYITFFTAILFVLQTIIGRPILPYQYSAIEDLSTGLARFYNLPSLLGISILLAFFSIKIVKINRGVLLGVFITALLFALGRIQIFSYLTVVLLGILMTGKTKPVLLVIGISIILIIPYSMVENRMNLNKQDIGLLYRTNYDDLDPGDLSGSTLLFRFAWINERATYLLKRPFLENLFGLGLVTESSGDLSKKYNFRIGLLSQKTGTMEQIYTPDIAYGNLMTKLGWLGGALLILIWINMLYIFFKRKRNSIFYSGFLAVVLILFTSISGVGIDLTQNMTIFFVLLSINYRRHENICTEVNNDANQLITITNQRL